MAFDKTITEYEMDAQTQQMVQGLQQKGGEFEPDLAVDGLDQSILSRILGLFGVGKS